MADAKLTALTAASALAAADLFYVSQSAASRKATGTQLLALVGTAYVPLAGGTMTGALTLPAGSAAAPALKFTVVGETGLFAESNKLGIAVNGTQIAYANTNGFWASGSTGLGILVDAAALYFGGSADCILRRDAAAVLAQRNGTNAQTLRVYNTYTDASNYERLTLTGVAGTSVNITAETLGTGADNLDIVLTPAGTGRLTTPAVFETSAIVAGILTGGATTINYYTGGVRIASTGEFAWTVGNANASVNVALMRNADGVVEVNNGTLNAYRDLKLRNLLNVEYHQMTEMTAPSAPATNSVRIYAEDNGAGKTRLMALFATGSAVQLGIEP